MASNICQALPLVRGLKVMSSSRLTAALKSAQPPARVGGAAPAPRRRCPRVVGTYQDTRIVIARHVSTRVLNTRVVRYTVSHDVAGNMYQALPPCAGECRAVAR